MLFQAQKIYSHIGSDAGEAAALQSLGKIYASQSRDQEAEKAFMEAYAIQSAHRQRPWGGMRLARSGRDLPSAVEIPTGRRGFDESTRNSVCRRSFTGYSERGARTGEDLQWSMFDFKRRKGLSRKRSAPDSF